MPAKTDVLPGTLDLIVLRALEVGGPMHGYGLARRIEQVSGATFAMNQGTLYPALLRLQQGGFIRSAWGTSANNRRARYYSLTASGRRRLERESRAWEKTAAVINRLILGLE